MTIRARAIKKEKFDSSKDIKKLYEPIPEEFRCPLEEMTLCGTLIAEKEKTRSIFLSLESIQKEKEKYQRYFKTLLKLLSTHISTPILIKDILKSNLSDIKEINSGYFTFTERRIIFWIFLEEENWDVEDKIYEFYGDLLEQFPNKEIDLRLMRLWGRDPKILLPEGFQYW